MIKDGSLEVQTYDFLVLWTICELSGHDSTPSFLVDFAPKILKFNSSI